METRTQAPISLALYQPDIPQNAGNLFRTAACFSVPVHVIEPCGFVLSHSKMRRAGMDYMKHVVMHRHTDWSQFQVDKPIGRTVLLTTKGEHCLPDFQFEAGDTLLLGRESAGVPDDVHESVDVRLMLPMTEGLRSMNVAIVGAIATFEALRQLQGLSKPIILSE